MNKIRVRPSAEMIKHSSCPGSLGSSGSSCMSSTPAHQTDWAYASRASTEM